MSADFMCTLRIVYYTLHCQLEVQRVQGMCEDDEEAFVKMIHQAWFSFYRRYTVVSE